MSDFKISDIPPTITTNNSARYEVFDNSMLVMPKVLDVLIKKTHPEIIGVSIKDVDSSLTYNPMDFSAIERFRLHISVSFKEGVQPKGVMEYYSEAIQDLFKYTYPEHDFVKFNVIEMNIPNPPSNRELFGRLFLPEQ